MAEDPRFTARRLAVRLTRRFGTEGAIQILSRGVNWPGAEPADVALWVRTIELLVAREGAVGGQSGLPN